MLLMINTAGVVLLRQEKPTAIKSSNTTKNITETKITVPVEEAMKVNADIKRVINFNDRSLAVVQSRDNTEYLTIDVLGQLDKMGTLFQAKEVNENSRNIVIYGHSSSKNDLRLTPFKRKAYITANQHFKVSQDNQEVSYRIIAYLNVDIDELSLPFYRTDWRTRSDFIDYLITANRESITAFTDDGIKEAASCLTLVTCDLRKQSKRWLVIAIAENSGELMET